MTIGRLTLALVVAAAGTLQLADDLQASPHVRNVPTAEVTSAGFEFTFGCEPGLSDGCTWLQVEFHGTTTGEFGGNSRLLRKTVSVRQPIERRAPGTHFRIGAA